MISDDAESIWSDLRKGVERFFF